MTYNILNGGLDGSSQDRLDTILTLISKNDPDILVLQEALKFADDGAKLLYTVERLLNRRAFLAEAHTGQHVVVLIRREQTVISVDVDNRNFHHAMLRLRLSTRDGAKFTVLGTHLCPHGSLNRLAEAQRIVNNSKDDHDVILMGDLNSLDHYGDYTSEVMSLANRYRARHLMPGETSRIDNRITRTLEAAGFVDIAHLLKHPGEDISTAPTKLETAGHEFLGMRVDYVYANASLAAKARSCSVIRCSETDKASDHYPVVADFEVSL